MPLSIRLIREVHQRLLTGARPTGHAYPGEIRTSQNWIGGGSPEAARFVPPPHSEVNRCLSDLEKFLHSDEPLSKLVKVALSHAQFETIHPVVDGNGRTGRLMVTFFLVEQGVLSRPILYLSEYFKRNREIYFDALQAYHDYDDRLGWTKFFLKGVSEVAAEAIDTCKSITALRQRDVERVAALTRSKSGIKLLQHLFTIPIVSERNVEQAMGLSRENSNRLVAKFVQANILRQSDEAEVYGLTFVYNEYLGVFKE